MGFMRPEVQVFSPRPDKSTSTWCAFVFSKAHRCHLLFWSTPHTKILTVHNISHQRCGYGSPDFCVWFAPTAPIFTLSAQGALCLPTKKCNALRANKGSCPWNGLRGSFIFFCHSERSRGIPRCGAGRPLHLGIFRLRSRWQIAQTNNPLSSFRFVVGSYAVAGQKITDFCLRQRIQRIFLCDKEKEGGHKFRQFGMKYFFIRFFKAWYVL